MPTIHFPRDVYSDAENVKNTFSSWDACMSQAYCKWPAIIGIVIGSLILISVIWCCARCLCCGVECCCGCCSCFNRCCPSPRSKNDGYQQPQNYPPYAQYQSPAPPMYFGGGYRPAPQTATFDAPTNRNGEYNEDALPAMPSWNTAASRRVEEDDWEMEKLDQRSSQRSSAQQSLLRQSTAYHSPQNSDGDIGAAGQGPYHEYSQHQQFAGSPTSVAAPSMYPPTYQTRPPSSVYTNAYAAGPPAYQTAPPSVASPTHARMNSTGVGRKPVSGSWRDV